MKKVACLFLVLLFGCALINTSSDDGPTTEWEKANRKVLEDYASNKQAGRPDPSPFFYRLLNNCIQYTTYSYQRNLCTVMRQQTEKAFKGETARNVAPNPNAARSLDNTPALPGGTLTTRELTLNVPLSPQTQPAGVLSDEFVDNFKKIATYFPRVPRGMEQVEQCMSSGSPAEKIICAEWSRTLENFANGGTSTLEFERQIATLKALVDAYGGSRPAFADYLVGAMKVYADSLPKTYNCTSQVAGNQIYTQCW